MLKQDDCDRIIRYYIHFNDSYHRSHYRISLAYQYGQEQLAYYINFNKYNLRCIVRSM